MPLNYGKSKAARQQNSKTDPMQHIRSRLTPKGKLRRGD